MRPLSLLLILAAVTLDALTVITAIQTNDLWLILSMHTLACLLFSFCAYRNLPTKFRSNITTTLSLITSVCFLIPILGMLSIIFIAVVVQRCLPHKESLPIRHIDTTLYMTDTHASKLKFGVGGAVMRLRQVNLPVMLRIEALLALDAQHSPLANRLISKTLHDDADQLRLLAFSLLDRQEKSISKEINQLLTSREAETCEIKLAQIDKRLADRYWEMVYMKLVKGDFRKQILAKALNYAKQAYQRLPDDSSLLILLGKLNFANQAYQQAYDYFMQAHHAGALPTRTLPYLADLSFRNKDFATVRELLKLGKYMQDIPKLNRIVQFWQATC